MPQESYFPNLYNEYKPVMFMAHYTSLKSILCTTHKVDSVYDLYCLRCV